MHPAYSVIFFTTASGAGYGLLALLGIFAAFGWVPADRWLGGVGIFAGLALVTAGLLSSTFHLGHPERAWRAFSQWRSSWLSREGVASVVAYAPFLILAYGWVIEERLWAWAGIASAVLAAVTVYCTSMIYVSLKAIPDWHDKWVTPTYLVLALATGAVWLDVILRAFGAGQASVPAAVSIAAAAVAKFLYWRSIDNRAPVATAESATGLGHLGKVRLLDAPHTSENYLQKEMGYRIARKHALKLRRAVWIALFAVPFVLAHAAAISSGALGLILAGLTAISASIGVMVERWLFFAEARHVVTLYYGADKV